MELRVFKEILDGPFSAPLVIGLHDKEGGNWYPLTIYQDVVWDVSDPVLTEAANMLNTFLCFHSLEPFVTVKAIIDKAEDWHPLQGSIKKVEK